MRMIQGAILGKILGKILGLSMTAAAAVLTIAGAARADGKLLLPHILVHAGQPC